MSAHRAVETSTPRVDNLLLRQPDTFMELLIPGLILVALMKGCASTRIKKIPAEALNPRPSKLRCHPKPEGFLHNLNGDPEKYIFEAYSKRVQQGE